MRRETPAPAVEPWFDAVVVLGCGVLPDGRPTAALARRIALAHRAHRAHCKVPLLVSGGKRWPGGHVEAAVMRAALMDLGVPGVQIVEEAESLSTLENAVFCARWLERCPEANVMLATCSWHLPRALACFRRQGVNAVAPPRAWWNTPPPSLPMRVREALCRGLDWTLQTAGAHDPPHDLAGP